jgi:hypothetical protein
MKIVKYEGDEGQTKYFFRAVAGELSMVGGEKAKNLPKRLVSLCWRKCRFNLTTRGVDNHLD